MKHSSFDDMIRQKTVGYQAAVPEGAWENIAQGKKKKRRIAFFWWYTMILVPLAIGFTWYHYQGDAVKISARETGLPAATKSERVQKMQQETTELHNGEEKPANNSRTVLVRSETVVTAQATGMGLGAAATASMMDRIPAVKNTFAAINKKKLYPQEATTVMVNAAANLEQENLLTGFVRMDPFDKYAAPHIDIPVYGPSSSSFADAATTATPAKPAKKKQAVKKSWSIDVSVTPFIPIQQKAGLLSLHRTQIGNGLKTEFTADEIATTVEASMAYGINIRRSLGARWQIGAGVQYARIWEKLRLAGTEITTNYYTVKRLVTGSTGPQLVDEQRETVNKGTRTITARGSYNVLSIPLFAQYKIMERRSMALQLNAGAHVRVWQPYKSSIQGDFKATYRSGLRQSDRKSHAGLDLMAALRVSAPLRKQFRLYTEPVFRYALLQNNSSGMINAKYLHQAGISFGVSYQLSK